MRPIASRILGALLVLGVLGVGGLDLRYGLERWAQLGPLPPGNPPRPFEVIALDGTRMTERDFRGKVTVVTFWATWCPACRKELSVLEPWYAGGLPDDVALWAVNIEGNGSYRETHRKVTAFRERREHTLPMALASSKAAKAFGVGPIPHTVVLDREGLIRHVHVGVVSIDTLAEQVEALREKP